MQIQGKKDCTRLSWRDAEPIWHGRSHHAITGLAALEEGEGGKGRRWALWPYWGVVKRLE